MTRSGHADAPHSPPIHNAKMAMTKKTDPIEQYLNTTGSGWCIKYVLIAVVEDEDSDQSFYIQCMENQTAAETIGLCEAVSHIQKVKIANAWIAREEDTDE